MILLVGFLTFFLYCAITLTRSLDPTGKVVTVNYYVLMGIFICLVCFTVINAKHSSNHIFMPINVLTYFEFLLLVTYKRTKELTSESTVVYINGLYLAIAPYLLVVPVLTIGGLAYMLCTN